MALSNAKLWQAARYRRPVSPFDEWVLQSPLPLHSGQQPSSRYLANEDSDIQIAEARTNIPVLQPSEHDQENGGSQNRRTTKKRRRTQSKRAAPDLAAVPHSRYERRVEKETAYTEEAFTKALSRDLIEQSTEEDSPESPRRAKRNNSNSPEDTFSFADYPKLEDEEDLNDVFNDPEAFQGTAIGMWAFLLCMVCLVVVACSVGAGCWELLSYILDRTAVPWQPILLQTPRNLSTRVSNLKEIGSALLGLPTVLSALEFLTPPSLGIDTTIVETNVFDYCLPVPGIRIDEPIMLCLDNVSQSSRWTDFYRHAIEGNLPLADIEDSGSMQPSTSYDQSSVIDNQPRSNLRKIVQNRGTCSKRTALIHELNRIADFVASKRTHFGLFGLEIHYHISQALKSSRMYSDPVYNNTHANHTHTQRRRQLFSLVQRLLDNLSALLDDSNPALSLPLHKLLPAIKNTIEVFAIQEHEIIFKELREVSASKPSTERVALELEWTLLWLRLEIGMPWGIQDSEVARDLSLLTGDVLILAEGLVEEARASGEMLAGAREGMKAGYQDTFPLGLGSVLIAGRQSTMDITFTMWGSLKYKVSRFLGRDATEHERRIEVSDWWKKVQAGLKSLRDGLKDE